MIVPLVYPFNISENKMLFVEYNIPQEMWPQIQNIFLTNIWHSVQASIMIVVSIGLFIWRVSLSVMFTNNDLPFPIL